ncbi:MAG: 2-dehydro-3-deoxyphosphogluconate aldolase [Candidatus Thermofonsia Clade 3 bacterium]|uniref:2-dehydro-3-deoxyphosphogluconate aldolase n=2 Tax=Candidatus Thermofonsia Clade 3 TaxID=2364209 RepID=A0A2M8QBZ7_9CHLR|nr:MAG: 2-dehydro-3-deoxyphosphogluconate aldolase [Candidatus Thermofonsia Clade 3 bacterium]
MGCARARRAKRATMPTDCAMLLIERRLRALFREQVVAIIRVAEAERALGLARALIAGGFRCVEVTMTVPGALDVIQTLCADAPEDVLIGAGTVTSAAEARRCIEVGAQFLVSPICETDIIRPSREAGVVAIPAGMTPTEIMHAWRLGAHVVKVFPAGAIGGPAFIRAVRGPLPDIPLWVSGAVQPCETQAYLAAGAQLVGLNAGALPNSLIESGDWAGLAAAARAMLDEARHAAKVMSPAS